VYVSKGKAAHVHGLPEPYAQAENLDALIIVPPVSPSETNPPLGPAILARAAASKEFHVGVLDLNILMFRRFRGFGGHQSLTLGDHGKDRSFISAAADTVYDATGLRKYPPVYLPDAADPVAGMHYSLPSISDALQLASSDATPLRSWLEYELRSRCDAVPPVVGVSLMGPSQVFIGLLVLVIVRDIWPSARTVLGGSHATLLFGEIQQDQRCGCLVDEVLTGHCEDQFVSLVAERSAAARRDSAKSRSSVASHLKSPGFEYLPLFELSQLALYAQDMIAIPVQFTRGCSYGRCTFCTYPAVEPILTRLDPVAAGATIRRLVAIHGIRRFSLKDSLFTAPMLRSFSESLLRYPPVEITWSATTKANRALIPLIPVLREAGLTTLEIGVESIHSSAQRFFDKRASISMVEEVIHAIAGAGITVVVNLIFGYPGERVEMAEDQLQWLLDLRVSAPPERINCSLNMLEIVRGSPLAMLPGDSVTLMGVAPWAFSYKWNAPPWRSEFATTLRAIERQIGSRAPNLLAVSHAEDVE
jgi:hypothetical protein